MKKTQKGFTLVELLVVIAILAILSTVAVVGYTSFINRAEKQAAETEAAQIDASIEAALVGNVAVKISDTLYVVPGTDGYEAVNAADPDWDPNKIYDLSTELGGFDLAISANDKLVYETDKYSVDVDTHVATKK